MVAVDSLFCTVVTYPSKTCILSHFTDFMSILTPVVMSGILPNFVPVVDGTMVPIHPRDNIATGSTKNHDLITGFTHHDGAGLIYLNPLG